MISTISEASGLQKYWRPEHDVRDGAEDKKNELILRGKKTIGGIIEEESKSER